MSDDADKSKLSEAQKSAKHDYSIHQDNLFWSRVQTLMAIQTGTLAGSYYLAYEKQDNLEVAWCLTALGVILTALLWIIAERDQLHRHKSLLASEVPETIINPGFPLNLNGGSAVRGRL